MTPKTKRSGPITMEGGVINVLPPQGVSCKTPDFNPPGDEKVTGNQEGIPPEGGDDHR